MFSRENPYTGQSHASLIRGPPDINQREQCILREGGNSGIKMVEVLRPLLAVWGAIDGMGGGGGVLMSHVDFKKCQCPMSLLLIFPHVTCRIYQIIVSPITIFFTSLSHVIKPNVICRFLEKPMSPCRI